MDNEAQCISTAAAGLGLRLTPEAATALAVHLAMVIEANKTMNLTSIEPEQAVALHVLDSLSALQALESAPPGPFADLGTGGGYPGVPLAILSGRTVALVESVQKKAAFLERVVEALRLKATVHPIRAEELALVMPEAFSAVTARAVSSLPSLVELASPLLVVGGLLVCMKGRVDQEEIGRGDRAAARCGMRRVSAVPVSVPGADVQRTIVTYGKIGAAKIKLPRRPGMAQRQPLA